MLRRCGYEGAFDDRRRRAATRRTTGRTSRRTISPATRRRSGFRCAPTDFYEEHGIDHRARPRDAPRHCGRSRVELEGHEPLPYDALLLATGAEPIHLGLPGEDDPHVHYLRSLADSRSIIAAAKNAKRAVVDRRRASSASRSPRRCARADSTCTSSRRRAVPLERVLGAQLGDVHQVAARGEGRRVPSRPQAGAHRGERRRARRRHARFDADLVVIGVGVRPRLALAEQAGLAMERA